MKPALLSFILASGLLAQAPAERLGLIRLVRTAAGSSEANPITPYRAAGSPADVLGLSSLTGLPQTWLIEAHGSFANLELRDQALARLSQRRTLSDLTVAATLIGVHRPALSYRPEEALRLFPTARYVHAVLFRMRPGSDVDFAELMKIRKVGLDTVNLDRPELGYQIISGSTSGTYLFLSPLPSLQAMDQGLARPPVYAEGAVHAAVKTGRQIVADADISRETFLFRVEPHTSYVSAAFAAADPEFWHPKTPQ